MKGAVFLDKDGTLVENVPYNVDPRRVALCSGAIPALRRLAGAGFELFVVSNQSGVARGLFEHAALDQVSERIATLLQHGGVTVAGFYYCPHHPEGTVEGYGVECDCRKPSPGLLRRAAADHNIDLRQSWMVGDILNDIEAGNASGCRTVLLDNGGETEWDLAPHRVPGFIVRNLVDAADTILRETQGNSRGGMVEAAR